VLFNQKIVNFSVGFMSVLLILAIISKLNIVMNRLHLKVTALLVVSIFVLSGCASILSRSTYPLSINSSPSNAKVSVTDKHGREIYLGNAPTIVRLRAGDGFFSRAEYQVKFSAPGYEEKIIPVTFSIDGWYFGNILLGGVVGMLIIDPATGAMWRIDADYLHATLNKSNAVVNSELKIVDLNEIPDSWKSHLVKVD
jgi:hypothetical protein